ncbi:GTP-dependent dephospho-CoA kinase family protein [Haloplanus sp. GCM10025708]|uniref:GTP-dependent dephospho-CoA kinase family protein n=1 Tax=Haloferacaceae TaxID=1644056 RepID=UPI00360F91AE
MLRLPEDLRGAFKEPLGPVFTDAEELLATAGTPIVAVGDVVTYHLRLADTTPDVALVDGRTEREAVSAEIVRVLGNPHVEVENEPGTLSDALLAALRDAIDADEPTTIHVDGEEDLATVPAVVAAPNGTSVVYGQPGEGMVLVTVDEDTRAIARDLLRRMDGDVDAALATLGG